MSAAASSTSRLANSPASGGGFDRPQVAITIGLEWRLPPARAPRDPKCPKFHCVPFADLFSGNPNQLLPTNRKKVSAQQNASLLIVQLRM
jgi:hypothetical protein